MRCQDLEPYLLDGLKDGNDSGLPPDLRDHLEACAACRALRDLWLGLGPLTAAEPDPELGRRFRRRLAAQEPPRSRGWLLPLAAAGVVLAAGFGAGFALRRQDPPRSAGASLAANLGRGSTSDRLQAIAMAIPGPEVNAKGLLEALLVRTVRDPDLQVRLAAVEALYLFGAEPGLASRLETALRAQDHPEVQLALVDLMAALRERRAADALRRLLQDERLGPEVRQRAAQGLKETAL